MCKTEIGVEKRYQGLIKTEIVMIYIKIVQSSCHTSFISGKKGRVRLDRVELRGNKVSYFVLVVLSMYMYIN